MYWPEGFRNRNAAPSLFDPPPEDPPAAEHVEPASGGGAILDAVNQVDAAAAAEGRAAVGLPQKGGAL